MSEIINVPMSGQRSLATVTAEIRTLQDAARRMAIEYSIEIGRKLVEAKSMVDHGEWTAYLREELGFSQSTANNHMRMFEAYGADQISMTGATVKSQAFANLSYTQALALLALPSEEEREAFVETHDMEELSTRELQAEIARLKNEAEEQADILSVLQEEKDAAEREARTIGERFDEAMEEIRTGNLERDRLKEKAESFRVQTETANNLMERRKKEAEAAIREKETAEKRAAEADERCAALLKKLEAAKKNPTVPKDVLDQIKKEAEAEAQKAADEAVKAAEAAAREEAVQEQAEKLAALQAEKEAAEKALLLAAPELAVFKAAFERVQKDLMELVRSVDGLPEDKRAGAWRGLHALLERALSECAGVFRKAEAGTGEKEGGS